MPKSGNLPNTPEIRCIDDFWSLIKGELYQDGWEAENLDQLRTRILNCSKKINQECVQNLGEST